MGKVQDILGEGNKLYTGGDLIARLDEAGYRVESKDAANWAMPPGSKTAHSVDIRIEALRAAATIMTAPYQPEKDIRGIATAVTVSDAEATLIIAEQFAAWLETGER